jgi:hypothetical protein
MSESFGESESVESSAEDFLDHLHESGMSIVWKQRTVIGKTAYGQPVPTWTLSTIPAIISHFQSSEAKLVEPGFQLGHYIVLNLDPAVTVGILDQFTYAEMDYEVRLTYPYVQAGVTVYTYALLRAILIHQPPP